MALRALLKSYCCAMKNALTVLISGIKKNRKIVNKIEKYLHVHNNITCILITVVIADVTYDNL
jgi:hypothetical protein